MLPDVARILTDNGCATSLFVIAGENRPTRGYAKSTRSRCAHAGGSNAIFRLTGHCPDMPAALAAADVVVVPAIEPPCSAASSPRRRQWDSRS